VNGVNAPSTRWLYSTSPSTVQRFSFNTPVGAQSEEPCGRAVYSNFHLAVGGAFGSVFPGVRFLLIIEKLPLQGHGWRSGYDGDRGVAGETGVPDLFATIASRIGLDHGKTFATPGGRAISLTDGGTPIAARLV
jgi:hypothetical protein